MSKYQVQAWRLNADPIAKEFEAPNITAAKKTAVRILEEWGIELVGQMARYRKAVDLYSQIPARWNRPDGARSTAYVDLFQL